MKRISVLGSTGFIGTSTLDVIATYPERFSVVGLAAGKNITRLAQQIQAFKPDVVSVPDEMGAEELKKLIPSGLSVRVACDQSGMIEVASHHEADTVVSAMVGSVGLVPTMAAIQSGKTVALANKETLVVAGRLMMEAARSRGVAVIPVDSEHSAIFQALQGNRREDVRRIILTASGGPFLQLDSSALSNITPEDALKHPVWEMGKKITIDSATMMNKGLEIIEARWLFDYPPEVLEVLIHPQSIIHSLVEYCDGSTMAQLSVPDMKIPISYALTYPERLETELPFLSLAEMGSLTFMSPDQERFPTLRLAYQALGEEESMAAVLNGANEVAVEAFLRKRIPFVEIPSVIERTMACHTPCTLRDIDEALEVDAWARQTASGIVDAGNER
jgi:1-deoxy-D-xylulose-5-phosphate reductoisomerase